MRPITDFILQRFPLFIGFYFLAHLFLRLASNNTLTIDESEQMLVSQYFSLGYNAQPPLYTWIQILFFRIFGQSILAIALLKNLFLYLLYIFTWLSAREISRDRLVATLSALSLILLFQIAWVAQIDQIHSAAVTTTGAAALYFFLRLVNHGRAVDYLIFGLVAGCGLLFKYNFLLLLLAMGLTCLSMAELRPRILTRKVFLALGPIILIILPHTLWFIQHTGLATGETIQRMNMDDIGHPVQDRLRGMADLLKASLAFVSPFWLVFLLLFRKGLGPSRYPRSKILGSILIWTVVLLVLIIMASGISNIKERWLQPYLFFFPLWCLLHVHKSELRTRATKLAATAAVFMSLVLLVIPLRLVTIDLTGKPHRENYPFKQLAERIQTRGIKPQLIVAQDMFIAGNLRLFFPQTLVRTPAIPGAPLPETETILLVWHNHKPPLARKILDLENYQCTEYEESIPFKFSRKLFYRPHYLVCRNLNLN
ncbi:glycosyltransferase family 39 protein [Desulfolithobacter sp.]